MASSATSEMAKHVRSIELSLLCRNFLDQPASIGSEIDLADGRQFGHVEVSQLIILTGRFDHPICPSTAVERKMGRGMTRIDRGFGGR
jgi:hypothetical protein